MRDPEIEAIEGASRAELESLQERKLRYQVEKAWNAVPFYRRRWESAGISPSDIRTLKDFQRLPIITKAELEQDLREHPPFGSYQGSVPPARIHATSGITGVPQPVFCTRADCDRIAALSARRWRAQGLQSEDRVLVTLPYTLYIGGAIAIEGALRLGAAIIPTGTGAMTPTARQVEIARDWRPTVLCATPSYALRLAETARQMNLDPAADFHFRVLYVTAEVLPSEMRRRIEQLWNCRVYDNYGSVEAAASTYECRCQNGWHVSEDSYIFEVVDPDTNRPVSSGEQGALVITSLFREAAPFFRFRVGDIVSLWEEPCECGRTFQRMSPVRGRADEMLKVRGVTLYPTAVELALRTFPELGSEWYLILEQAAQEAAVQVESAAALDRDRRSDLARRVQNSLKDRIGIQFGVEIFEPGALIGRQAAEGRIKSRRVIDRRNPLTSDITVERNFT